MATVLLAGGTGTIGMRLSEMLKQAGYEVLHLSRRRDLQARFPAYAWDLKKGFIEEEAIARADFLINLAGAGIADKPWTEERKRVIINSRVDGNLLLKKYLDQMDRKPSAFISSAAIGYYGNTGEQWVDETTPAGTGFLSESCLAWEESIEEIRKTGIRTVAFRIGLVLSPQDGVLEKIKLPLYFFTGVYFGDGRQWYSWIHVDDLCRMFVFALKHASVEGVYNAVAPHPVRNKEMVRQIADAMGKPVVLLPAPVFALRLALGEMADAVLTGTRVSSDKIEAAGFQFHFPDLKPALEDLLGKV